MCSVTLHGIYELDIDQATWLPFDCAAFLCVLPLLGVLHQNAAGTGSGAAAQHATPFPSDSVPTESAQTASDAVHVSATADASALLDLVCADAPVAPPLPASTFGGAASPEKPGRPPAHTSPQKKEAAVPVRPSVLSVRVTH